MKNSIICLTWLILLGITLINQSCQKDSFLNDEMEITEQSKLLERTSMNYSINSILEVEKKTVYHHPGVVKDNGGETGLPAAEPVVLKDIYLYGTGDAWSVEYGRMRVTLDLVYDFNLKRTQGKAVYILEDGVEMHVDLKSDKPIQEIPMFDGPHYAIILSAKMLANDHQKPDAGIAYLLDAENLEDPEVTRYSAKFIVKSTDEHTLF